MAPERTKKVRLNTRMPEDLVRWVREHARKKNTNVTQLIVDELTKMREKSEKKHG